MDVAYLQSHLSLACNERKEHGGRLALRLALLCACSAAALTPAVVAAQTQLALASATSPTSSAEIADTGDIVVTAEKRGQSINSVPMSIVAATGEQLRNRGITEVRDLSKIVAGFSYSDSSNGTPIYTLRGIGFSDVSIGGRPTVSIYNDEAPLPFSIETIGSQIDLERVEVLKGPQGILFGSNSTGGAINYIAAKPTDTFRAGANGSAGRFNTFNLGGYLSGPITDTLKVRLALDDTTQGAWQRSYTTGQTLGRGNLLAGRFLVDWTPTSRLTVRLNANGFYDTRETQAPQVIAIQPSNPGGVAFLPTLLTYPLAPPDNRAADWFPGVDYARDNRFYQVNGRIDYDLTNDFKLTSLTSYSQYKERQRFSNTGLNLPVYALSLGDVETIFQEARLAGSLSSRLNVIVGANYEADKALQDNYPVQTGGTIGYSFKAAFGLPVFTNFHEYTYQRSKSWASFANADYELTNTVRVHLGARYSELRTSFRGCSADSGDGVASSIFIPFYNFVRGRGGLPPLPPAANGACLTAGPAFVPTEANNRLKEHNVAWRAGLDWKVTPGTLLYANVSRGFKAGGFPDLGATQIAQYTPATQEQITAYEAGFKTHAILPHVQINGALFHYDYNDKQVLGYFVDQVFGPINRLVNVPKSRINGAELEVAWNSTMGLSLSANAAYIDSKILGSFVNFNSNALPQDFGGEPFPNTPRFQGTLSGEYKFAIAHGREVFAGVDYSYRTSTNSQLGRNPLTAIREYGLLDLRAGVQSHDGNWRVMAFGKNVTDQYYWTAAYRVPDTVVRYTGRPATYGVAFTYQY